MHATLIYDVTLILDPVHAKGAFLQVGTQFVLWKDLKDLLNVFKVFFLTLAEDEDVVKINNHEWDGEEMQDIIH